ncbi:MAG TPA: epimerase [Sphingobacteriaceae bacterium]|nr:epimerase [Sphingobacteriaceae bacterium]
MKAVIFGANGQDGIYLQEECRRSEIQVVPFSRSLNKEAGDVSQYGSVANIISVEQPDYIFHLAANSTTRHDALFENHETISTGTLNILEAVKRHKPTAKVFITGSGVQFKNTGQPITEDADFEASSPYAIARIHSVYAARYFRSLGIKSYVGYLFNHESPFRKESGVSQKIVKAVKRIAAGSSEKIEMGNINVEKEWAFAGDIAKGILKLVEQDDLFEAVIGSGKAYSIREWIEICFSLIGKDWKEYVIEQDNFKGEYGRLVSMPNKMISVGWHTETNINELAEMMLADSSL